MIDQEDKHLQQLRKEWGYEVYLAVAIALIEIKEYNMKVRTTTHQLWNFKDGRKATLKEAILFNGEKIEGGKDQRYRNQTNRWQSQSSCVYSQPQITGVAESLVGDETGTIIFTARKEQVDLMEPGSILLLYGAKVQMYRGFMRLAVEYRIQIIIAEPVEFVVNEDDEQCLWMSMR
ncbi:PREDICTED: uncharacterized protein LOC109222942 [Nicotiana attenuata]|nr:PREDICTED: uncharacterized protein LOC109222942 [Nicotiana attenuata]